MIDTDSKDVHCSKIGRISFLMNVAGPHLAYTELDAMEAKAECGHGYGKVINLTRKGLFKINPCCEISAPVFTINTPSNLGAILLPEAEYAAKVSFTGIHLWNTSKNGGDIELDSPTKLDHRPYWRKDTFPKNVSVSDTIHNIGNFVFKEILLYQVVLKLINHVDSSF